LLIELNFFFFGLVWWGLPNVCFALLSLCSVCYACVFGALNTLYVLTVPIKDRGENQTIIVSVYLCEWVCLYVLGPNVLTYGEIL